MDLPIVFIMCLSILVQASSSFNSVPVMGLALPILDTQLNLISYFIGQGVPVLFLANNGATRLNDSSRSGHLSRNYPCLSSMTSALTISHVGLLGYSTSQPTTSDDS
jgi:hypothetical protein